MILCARWCTGVVMAVIIVHLSVQKFCYFFYRKAYTAGSSDNEVEGVGLLGSRVRIPPWEWMPVSCDCRLL
jgi:hypothetical protein